MRRQNHVNMFGKTLTTTRSESCINLFSVTGQCRFYAQMHVYIAYGFSFAVNGLSIQPDFLAIFPYIIYLYTLATTKRSRRNLRYHNITEMFLSHV